MEATFAGLERAGGRGARARGRRPRRDRVRPPARPALRRPELRADRSRPATTWPSASTPSTTAPTASRAGRAGRVRQPAPDERRPDREAAAARGSSRATRRAESAPPRVLRRERRLRRLPDLRPLRAAGRARASPGRPSIEEFDSTTVVHPGFTVRVDDVGNLIIEREATRERAVRHRRLEGRDGRRCGTASASRPTSTGPRATASSCPGRFPTIVCITPYDKTERRYTEIADFFVPRGYAVVLQDLRDRHRSEGTKRVLPQRDAAHGRGRLRHDRVDRRAAVVERAHRAWSAARTPCITQIRTALERPPHLTAIWPDVAPTNTYHHQTREGGAMQLHMFWALYIHAADAQEVQARPGAAGGRLGRPAQPARADLGLAVAQGRARAAARADARRDARELLRRAAPTTSGGRPRRTTSRASSHEHADIPATMTTGWYDGFPHADTEYFAAMAAKNTAPQRLIVGPWSHVGMRGDATFTLDVDFGEPSRWGVRRYFDEQLALVRPLAARRRDRPAAGRGAGADLRDGRRQRPQDRRSASSTTAAAGATSRSGRSRARCRRRYHLHGDGSLAAEPRRRRRAAARSPTTPRIRCRRSAATTARSASSRRPARGWSRCGCGC